MLKHLKFLNVSERAPYLLQFPAPFLKLDSDIPITLARACRRLPAANKPLKQLLKARNSKFETQKLFAISTLN